MRHLYPFLFRFYLTLGENRSDSPALDIEIREVLTKRSAFRSIQKLSSPQMSQRGFHSYHFYTMLLSSSAKMPTTEHKPQEAQLSVGFFLVG